MHRIDYTSPTPDRVVVRVAGRLDAAAVGDLGRLLGEASAACQRVDLDLGAVTCASPAAVEFLAGVVGSSCVLRTCPHYLRDWLAQRGSKESSR